MHRRTIVRALGLLAAGTGTGCSGSPEDTGTAGAPTPGGPPTGPTEDGDGGASGGAGGTPSAGGTPPASQAFTVPDFGFAEGPDGNLVVTVTVANVTDRRRAARMTVSVTVDGEPVSASRRIAVDGGASREFDVTIPAAYADWEDNRNLGSVTFGPPGTTTSG